MPDMSRNPIHIIGAGIGGLTLGRCLLKHGIPSVLYERVPSSTRRHNYGITLRASSYKPLLEEVLGMSEGDFRRLTAVDGSIGGRGQYESGAGVYQQDSRSSFRAHRAKLEKLLGEGLDIRWEHSLEAVEEKPGSGLTLHFKGSSQEKVSCVIGADGPHSSTRKSVLPQIPYRILPFVTFNGKRQVARDHFNTVYATAFSNTNVLGLKLKDTVLSISVDDYLPDIVCISWIYSRPSKGAADALFKPNRRTSNATDIPAEFYEEIHSYRGLPEPFKEVFDAQKLKGERVLNWLMRSVLVSRQQLRDLTNKSVYFIGDSVHAEPILGGEGANGAIRDGLELAKCIARTGKEGIIAWYDKMYPIWEAAAKESEMKIGEIHDPQSSAVL